MTRLLAITLLCARVVAQPPLPLPGPFDPCIAGQYVSLPSLGAVATLSSSSYSYGSTCSLQLISTAGGTTMVRFELLSMDYQLSLAITNTSATLLSVPLYSYLSLPFAFTTSSTNIFVAFNSSTSANSYSLPQFVLRATVVTPAFTASLTPSISITPSATPTPSITPSIPLSQTATPTPASASSSPPPNTVDACGNNMYGSSDVALASIGSIATIVSSATSMSYFCGVNISTSLTGGAAVFCLDLDGNPAFALQSSSSFGYSPFSLQYATSASYSSFYTQYTSFRPSSLAAPQTLFFSGSSWLVIKSYSYSSTPALSFSGRVTLVAAPPLSPSAAPSVSPRALGAGSMLSVCSRSGGTITLNAGSPTVTLTSLLDRMDRAVVSTILGSSSSSCVYTVTGAPGLVLRVELISSTSSSDYISIVDSATNSFLYSGPSSGMPPIVAPNVTTSVTISFFGNDQPSLYTGALLRVSSVAPTFSPSTSKTPSPTPAASIINTGGSLEPYPFPVDVCARNTSLLQPLSSASPLALFQAAAANMSGSTGLFCSVTIPLDAASIIAGSVLRVEVSPWLVPASYTLSVSSLASTGPPTLRFTSSAGSSNWTALTLSSSATALVLQLSPAPPSPTPSSTPSPFPGPIGGSSGSSSNTGPITIFARVLAVAPLYSPSPSAVPSSTPSPFMIPSPPSPLPASAIDVCGGGSGGSTSVSATTPVYLTASNSPTACSILFTSTGPALLFELLSPLSYYSGPGGGVISIFDALGGTVAVVSPPQIVDGSLFVQSSSARLTLRAGAGSMAGSIALRVIAINVTVISASPSPSMYVNPSFSSTPMWPSRSSLPTPSSSLTPLPALSPIDFCSRAGVAVSLSTTSRSVTLTTGPAGLPYDTGGVACSATVSALSAGSLSVIFNSVYLAGNDAILVSSLEDGAIIGVATASVPLVAPLTLLSIRGVAFSFSPGTNSVGALGASITVVFTPIGTSPTPRAAPLLSPSPSPTASQTTTARPGSVVTGGVMNLCDYSGATIALTINTPITINASSASNAPSGVLSSVLPACLVTFLGSPGSAIRVEALSVGIPSGWYSSEPTVVIYDTTGPPLGAVGGYLNGGKTLRTLAVPLMTTLVSIDVWHCGLPAIGYAGITTPTPTVLRIMLVSPAFSAPPLPSPSPRLTSATASVTPYPTPFYSLPGPFDPCAPSGQTLSLGGTLGALARFNVISATGPCNIIITTSVTPSSGLQLLIAVSGAFRNVINVYDAFAGTALFTTSSSYGESAQTFFTSVSAIRINFQAQPCCSGSTGYAISDLMQVSLVPASMTSPSFAPSPPASATPAPGTITSLCPAPFAGAIDPNNIPSPFIFQKTLTSLSRDALALGPIPAGMTCIAVVLSASTSRPLQIDFSSIALNAGDALTVDDFFSGRRLLTVATPSDPVPSALIISPPRANDAMNRSFTGSSGIVLLLTTATQNTAVVQMGATWVAPGAAIPTASVSPTASVTSLPTLTLGASRSTTPSASNTPTSTPSATPSRTPSTTTTSSSSSTPTPSSTATPTSSLSTGASPSITPSAPNTPSVTPSQTSTGTSSGTPSPTSTSSSTSTPSTTSTLSAAATLLNVAPVATPSSSASRGSLTSTVSFDATFRGINVTTFLSVQEAFKAAVAAAAGVDPSQVSIVGTSRVAAGSGLPEGVRVTTRITSTGASGQSQASLDAATLSAAGNATASINSAGGGSITAAVARAAGLVLLSPSASTPALVALAAPAATPTLTGGAVAGIILGAAVLAALCGALMCWQLRCCCCARGGGRSGASKLASSSASTLEGGGTTVVVEATYNPIASAAPSAVWVDPQPPHVAEDDMWDQHSDETGDTWYVHRITGESAWERPQRGGSGV